MAENKPEKSVSLLKVYVQDISFESPRALSIFSQKGLPAPKKSIEMSIAKASRIGASIFEVVMNINVTTGHEDKVYCLAEVAQAGLFKIEGYSDEELKPLLGGVCPDLLFPYARQCVADLFIKGGFPPVVPGPMDFQALFKKNNPQTSKTAEKPDDAATEASEQTEKPDEETTE